jgi:hypothetical protein
MPLCDVQNATSDEAVGHPLVAIQDGTDVSVTFQILSGNDDGIFKIGYCNGQIRIQLPILNYRAQNTYVLSVAARSNGLLTSTTIANITVLVMNVPHNPVFNASSCSRSIPENCKWLVGQRVSGSGSQAVVCRCRCSPSGNRNFASCCRL